LPQPNFEKVFRPQLKHARTEPKPFSFDEKDRERWQKKEEKINDVYKEEEKVKKSFWLVIFTLSVCCFFIQKLAENSGLALDSRKLSKQMKFPAVTTRTRIPRAHHREQRPGFTQEESNHF
jgi:hypothetical protein